MDVNARMVKVNVTLIVLLLLFVAVVAIRAGSDPETRWTYDEVFGDADTGHLSDVLATAGDDVRVLGDEGTAHHWNGTLWTVGHLPVAAVALGGVEPDDLWAVGHQNVDATSTRGPELTQPAAAHWDGRAWKPVRMPDHHFPAPSPPEAQALPTDVAARAKDDVRVYGEHTFNHGEQHSEPADADIRLRWDGTRWLKLPDAEGPCADRGRAIRDGERGKEIARAELPSTGEIRSNSKQSLRLDAITAVPGTDTILGIGSVQVSQGSHSLSGSVMVSLKR